MSNYDLVEHLNALLLALQIPIALQSPKELTPSLLLAILESLLGTRIPISPSLRQSTSYDDKVQMMKLFLGILETDVLKADVGISYVDPNAVARGELTSVSFLGELLLWIGMRLGLIPKNENLSFTTPPSSPRAYRSRAGSSSSHSNSTGTTRASKLSMRDRSRGDDSMTSFGPGGSPSDIYFSVASHVEDSVSHKDVAIGEEELCIHDLPTPSTPLSPLKADIPLNSIDATHLLDSSSLSYCTCPSEPSIPHLHPQNIAQDNQAQPQMSVREEGLIHRVDEALELERYEHSHSLEHSDRAQHQNGRTQIIRDANAQARVQLKESKRLLKRRADLLEQLAEMKRRQVGLDYG